jgi:hypothetical protein
MYKLNFKKTTNRYSKKDLFDNIEKVWNYKNKQPIILDMICSPSTIHFGTYYNHFGSWKKALIEFVKYKNSGVIIKEAVNNIASKRKTINNSLRYDIMKRDRFKCSICGDSPSNNLSTILEIDHIIPVNKGGLTTESNLQTICRKCNSGKSCKL